MRRRVLPSTHDTRRQEDSRAAITRSDWRRKVPTSLPSSRPRHRERRALLPGRAFGKVVRMKRQTSQPPQVNEEGVPARPPAGFLAQGVNFAKRFTRDRLTKPDATSASEIKAGQATVIGVDGDKVGAYRDAEGLACRSAICAHRGCVVEWNSVDKSWDCPCHGSRFDYDGHILRAPAQREPRSRRSRPPSSRLVRRGHGRPCSSART